ncbi:MAG: sigma-70 family RNA polymerase sigma factor [Phycisphaerales bacterium]|nr:sigma-70 family RNA polymerase sigma factor [Phycisphaerales bacterium]
MQRHDVTQILSDMHGGDKQSLEKLLPMIYDELHALAESQLRQERAGHTLQATALVNEAYLKLVELKHIRWEGRAHFFGAAARIIRRILVDHARGKDRLKRGGDRRRIPLDASAIRDVTDHGTDSVDLIALHEALEKLEALDARQSKIVELRFFGGLGMKEIADVLGVSLRTVEGDWSMARAWLSTQLAAAGEAPETP